MQRGRDLECKEWCSYPVPHVHPDKIIVLLYYQKERLDAHCANLLKRQSLTQL